MESNKFSESQFLIIVGQPKAGTTSLFDWMAQHPEVRPSSTKETRFFLDANYPLSRSFAFTEDNVSDYSKNFRPGPGFVYMEATPDYLYNATALNIKECLPNAKLVLVVRDPLERINSAFYFYKQRGLLPSSWNVNDYVIHMSTLVVSDDTPIPMRALDQCKPHYVDRFKKHYKDRLLVIDFRSMCSNPKNVYREICAHVGLQEVVTTKFEKQNVTRSSRYSSMSRVFYMLKSRTVYFLRRRGFERLIPFFSPINLVGESILGAGRVAKEPLSDRTILVVKQYLSIDP